MTDGEDLTLADLADGRILVVEDNPGAQTAIRLALRRKGLTKLSFAETVRGGIKLFAEDPEDWICAILDARVPDGSGLEVARHIAEHNPTCGLVVLTARWDDAVVNEALGVPVHAFGHKPFDIEGPAGLVLRAVAQARGVSVSDDASLDPQFQEVAASLSNALTPKQRYIVAMRLAERSYAEIGETLNVSVETVRSHLKHARKRMGGKRGEDLLAIVQRAAAQSFDEKIA